MFALGCVRLREITLYLQIFCFLLTLEKFEFQLRGNTGDEFARIHTRGEAAKTFEITDLKQQWQTYSFPVSEKKTFLIRVDAPKNDEAVYFKPAHDYEIHFLEAWKMNWNCGQENENERCGKVRKGEFPWTGLYNFTYVEPGMSLLSFCAY